MSPAVSLLTHGEAQALNVEIQCLQSGIGCAALYFPSVTVLPEPVNAPFHAWAAVLVAALLILVLKFLLNLRRIW